MYYKANYYDGVTSKKYFAKIYVHPEYWKISYLDDHDKTITVFFKISEINKSTVYTKGWQSFTFGKTFPCKKIESNDQKFLEYIKFSKNNNLNNKIDLILNHFKYKSLLLLIPAILTIAAGIYFYLIPFVSTSFVSKMSSDKVISFGNYVFDIVSEDLEIDEAKSEKLQEFVDELKIDSGFPIKIYVANSKVLNAFAISGGKIVIFSSLLEKIKTKEQLVALIGHEVSHIKNRHVLKSLSRNLSGAIFISILFSDVNGITTVLTENAHLFSQLSYTRELEKEADNFGLEIMKKNDLDMFGMVQLFEVLKKETPYDIPAYFSSHPLLKDRILNAQKIAKENSNPFENNSLKEKWEALKQVVLAKKP